MNHSTIDLFNPDKMALLQKWDGVLDKVKRIWSWTSDSEIAWLCELASRSSGPFLELGSFVGKSARAQLLASPAAHITSIDLWDDAGSFDEYQFNLRKEDEAGRVRTMPFATHHGLRALGTENGEKFAHAFIDAGHLIDDVRGDIAGVIPLMKPGAIIAGHDYRHDLPEDGVTKAVREAFPSHFTPIDSIWCVRLPG